MKIVRGKKEDLEKKATQFIKKSIKDVLKNKEKVIFGICGGRNVGRIFTLLLKEEIDWLKVHIFFVDERLVNKNNPDLNYTLAKETFLDKLIKSVKGYKENIHSFFYSGNAKKDVLDYAKELKKYGGKFDIILLSAGENSHVACLHPNHETVKSDDDYFIYTNNSPKLPKNRMTATKKLLMKSDYSVLLFFGKEKSDAFDFLCDKSVNVKNCPAKIVVKIKNSFVFVDIG